MNKPVLEVNIQQDGMWSWRIVTGDFEFKGEARSFRRLRKQIEQVVALRRLVLTIDMPAEHCWRDY